MRFTNEGDAGDVQDRRGIGRVGMGAGLSLGGVVIVALVSLITRHNFFADLSRDDGQANTASQPAAPRTPEEAQSEHLVRAATTDIENFWTEALPRLANHPFPRTQLVLFTDVTDSGCGSAESATGPFYCPADQLVYVDLGFYTELATRFHAPGQFAEAYVLAHEFGHHVQHILGIDSRVAGARGTGEGSASVRLELQADCYAGIWGASAAHRGLLDPGEVEQGIAAAAAVGDDRLQRMGGRAVNPDSFTHGSSAERVSWFRRGFDSGTIAACDTFAGDTNTGNENILGK